MGVYFQLNLVRDLDGIGWESEMNCTETDAHSCPGLESKIGAQSVLGSVGWMAHVGQLLGRCHERRPAGACVGGSTDVSCQRLHVQAGASTVPGASWLMMRVGLLVFVGGALFSSEGLACDLLQIGTCVKCFLWRFKADGERHNAASVGFDHLTSQQSDAFCTKAAKNVLFKERR